MFHHSRIYRWLADQGSTGLHSHPWSSSMTADRCGPDQAKMRCWGDASPILHAQVLLFVNDCGSVYDVISKFPSEGSWIWEGLYQTKMSYKRKEISIYVHTHIYSLGINKVGCYRLWSSEAFEPRTSLVLSSLPNLNCSKPLKVALPQRTDVIKWRYPHHQPITQCSLARQNPDQWTFIARSSYLPWQLPNLLIASP